LKLLRLTVVLLLCTSPLLAATRKLTFDDIYDPKKKISFGGRPLTGMTWIDDTHYFWPRTDSSGQVTGELLVDARTGKELAFFDIDDLQAQVAKIEGVSADEAKRISRPKNLNIHLKSNTLLLSVKDDLFSYSIPSRTLTRLTSVDGEEEEASFSPDGGKVAFLRGNDLYFVDVATRSEKRLTTDGSDETFNGRLDWVYQEEIYGRGNFKGYWWSPDSRSIAYLRFNEEPVHEFAVVNHIPVRGEVENTNYPKAGDPNPIVSLLVTDLAGQSRTISNPYGEAEILYVDVTWRPDSGAVVFQVQDREQTWLDLNEGTTSGVKKLLRETTKAWVDPNGSPSYLKDGSFLWLSERNGWKHIYRVSADGAKQTPVTRGEWEVRNLHGVDQKSGWIYFSGTARSHIGTDVFRVKLGGGTPQRLSEAAGTHTASFNPGMTMYLDSWSDINTPVQARLHSADGKMVRVIDANPVPELATLELSKPEFLQVKTRDGFVMEAIMIKPRDFDPSKKYPVYQHTYAGPHAPQVRNAWGGSGYMFHQLLAQEGIIVWIIDNRSASGKGAISAWPAYKKLGEGELADIEDGLNYLKSQPWIDGSRMMLNGWSYGGFMTTYAMTHSKSFKAGIAGGSVTDWRNYDSVYTERFMLTPQNNKEGYDRTAPNKAAANLHGNLLLLHGTIDDNVHMANTIQFIYELQKANKPFELMVYPKSRHGVVDPLLVRHMRMTMLEFIRRQLK
jgi:dipeptidyl-peptidase 4